MLPLRSLLPALLLTLPLCSCSDDPAVEAKGTAAGKELGEAWDSLVDYGYARRDELERQFEQQLVAGESKLEELQGDVGALTGEARAALERQIEELEVDLEQGRERLGELRAAAEGGWAEARDRAAKALQALRGDLAEAPR